jgi:hypothetical protein
MNNNRPLFYILVIIFLLFGWLAFSMQNITVAWSFIGTAFVIAMIVSTVCVLDSLANLFEQKAGYAKYLIDLDPQGRDMIDINWPRLHLRMNEGAFLTVDDSGVELFYFRKFLNASNAKFIVTERSYNDKTIERKQYYLWQKYLLLEGAIIAERGQTETWRWSNPDEWYRWKVMYCDLKPPTDLLPRQTDAPFGTQPLPTDDTITRQFGEKL